MAFMKELIVRVVFVAVVVKSFPGIYEENATGGERRRGTDRGRGSGMSGHAYSYHHFSGPVIGHHEEIAWKGKPGHHHHDYKAHPKYKYSYDVDDHRTRDRHGPKEHRDGKHVEGEYHIHEPGGNVRSVKYHADSHGGFHAEVHQLRWE